MKILVDEMPNKIYECPYAKSLESSNTYICCWKSPREAECYDEGDIKHKIRNCPYFTKHKQTVNPVDIIRR